MAGNVSTILLRMEQDLHRVAAFNRLVMRFCTLAEERDDPLDQADCASLAVLATDATAALNRLHEQWAEAHDGAKAFSAPRPPVGAFRLRLVSGGEGELSREIEAATGGRPRNDENPSHQRDEFSKAEVLKEHGLSKSTANRYDQLAGEGGA